MNKKNNAKQALQTKKEESTVLPQSTENIEINIQIEQEKSKRLELMADFDNYKKRVESEKAIFGALANMTILREILEVSDDIQLALEDSELSLERAKQSLKTVQDKLIGAAATSGIEKIEVKPGDDFDKEKMEAVQAIPNAEMAGKVVAVISSAYKYATKEGILKPAKVIVGK